MQSFDLIDYVVPRGGIYNVVGMKEGRPIPKFTDSLEVAYTIADEFSEQGMDVFFALGKLKEKGNIYLICKSGKRSRAVAYHLSKELDNCNVYSCIGGIDAYTAV